CALKPLLEQMLGHRLPGRKPTILLHWGSTSPHTTDDAAKAVQAAKDAVECELVSKSAAARYVGPYLGVSDVDQDRAAVDGGGLGKQSADVATMVDLVKIPSP